MRRVNTAPPLARRIGVLVYPGIELLDAIGPLEVFAATNRVVQERDAGAAAPYAVEIWAAEAGLVSASSGVGLFATHSFTQRPDPGGLDTLFVGGSSPPLSLDVQPCVDWIAAISCKTRRVGGICTGVFLLAEAGLLDGRRAVTHWACCAALADRYPAIQVDADPIFVRDGPFFTSAGVTAGMDLALAMVQDDLGRDVALAVARVLVMFLKRPGGQSQFSAHLAAQLDGDGPIARIQAWILDNLGEDLTINTLARRAAMSPRSFLRSFTRETRMPPAAFVERARLDAARRQLEDSDDRLEAIAARCGFQSSEILRRLFQRHLGVNPTAYRARFRSAS
jgi:transcriptional regulator GlxA family with amidase domain